MLQVLGETQNDILSYLNIQSVKMMELLKLLLVIVLLRPWWDIATPTFFKNFFITIYKTSYKDIQYTTLLIPLALLTTQYTIPLDH